MGEAFCIGLTIRGATMFLEGCQRRGEPQRMFYNPETSAAEREENPDYSTYEQAFEQLRSYRDRGFVCVPMCDHTDEKGNCLGHKRE